MPTKLNASGLRAYRASLPKRADDAAEETVKRAKKYTKERAPVKTGNLRDSIDDDESLDGPGRRGLWCSGELWSHRSVWRDWSITVRSRSAILGAGMGAGEE